LEEATQLIEDCVDEFHKASDRMTKFIRVVVEKLEMQLRQEGIMARVSARVKSRDSLKLKLQKWLTDEQKRDRIRTKQDVFAEVGDLAAVRVMTYVERDREKVTRIVRSLFSSPPDKADFDYEKKETSDRIKNDDQNYYRATHMQISLRKEDLIGDYDNLKSDHCELQITSMLAHVWNEIEHDVGYKGDKKNLLVEESVALESLGLLTKAGDNIILSLIDASNRRVVEHHSRLEETIRDTKHLAHLLQEHFGPDIFGVNVDFNARGVYLLRAINDLSLNHSDLLASLKPATLRRFIQDEAALLKAFNDRIVAASQPDFDISCCDILTLVLVFENLDRLLATEYRGRGRRPRYLVFVRELAELMRGTNGSVAAPAVGAGLGHSL